MAFTQDANGTLDITPGKKYIVYGKRKNKLGDFYLVLTDSIHTRTPWWMPAELYKVIDMSVPSSWVGKSKGILSKDSIMADEIYFRAINDIEDGTERGVQAFSIMHQKNGDR